MDTKEKPISLLKLIIIPGILMTVFAVGFIYYLYTVESNYYKTISDNEVNNISSLINRKYLTALISTKSIKAFFEGSQEVTESEFQKFSDTISKESVASGIDITLEWLDGNNIIRYVYPMNEANIKVVGTDINQFPNRLVPIIKAKTSNSVVATDPLMLSQGYPGFILYVPIYRNNNYLGMAVGVVKMSDILASDTSRLYVYNEFVETDGLIVPYDNNNVIYTTSGDRISNSSGNLVADPLADQYLNAPSNVGPSINVGDKVWQLKFLSSYSSDVELRILIYSLFAFVFIASIIILTYFVYIKQKRIVSERARSEAFLTSIDDGIIACDKNGIVTYVNGSASKIIAEESSVLLGKNLYEVWPAVDDKGQIIKLDKRPYHIALMTGKPVMSTLFSRYFLKRKDETKIPIESDASPIIIEGKVTGVIVSFRDISKESEVDRMKSEFLSLASHQLLTPISATKWLSEMLLDGEVGELNDKQKEYITDIQSSASRMGDLVKSLLNISRIESGRLMVKPEPSNILTLINEVVKEVKIKSDIKKQKIDIKIANNIPQINIDPHLIAEVYKNLLTNAIKYTPENGTIVIEVAIKDNDIISKVVDNGYGIPANEQNKVFQKFYRGENIVQKEKDGNGLGLYLVKQIIEVSGGTIGFESVENKGTTFWFTLPLAGSNPKIGEVGIS